MTLWPHAAVAASLAPLSLLILAPVQSLLPAGRERTPSPHLLQPVLRRGVFCSPSHLPFVCTHVNKNGKAQGVLPYERGMRMTTTNLIRTNSEWWWGGSNDCGLSPRRANLLQKRQRRRLVTLRRRRVWDLPSRVSPSPPLPLSSGLVEGGASDSKTTSASRNRALYDKLISAFEAASESEWAAMMSDSRHWSSVADGVLMRLTEKIAFEDSISRQDELRIMWRKLMSAHHDWIAKKMVTNREEVEEYVEERDPSQMSTPEVLKLMDRTPDPREQERILEQHSQTVKQQIRKKLAPHVETIDISEIEQTQLPRDLFPSFRVTPQEEAELNGWIDHMLSSKPRTWQKILDDDEKFHEPEYREKILEQLNRRICAFEDHLASAKKMDGEPLDDEDQLLEVPVSKQYQSLVQLRHRIRMVEFFLSNPHAVHDMEKIRGFDAQTCALILEARKTKKVLNSFKRMTTDDLGRRIVKKGIPLNPDRLEELCENLDVEVSGTGNAFVNVFDFVQALKLRTQSSGDQKQPVSTAVSEFTEKVEQLYYVTATELHSALIDAGMSIALEDVIVHFHAFQLEFGTGGTVHIEDLLKKINEALGVESGVEMGLTNDNKVDEMILNLESLSLDALFEVIGEDESWHDIEEGMDAKILDLISAEQGVERQNQLKQFHGRLRFTSSRIKQFRKLLSRFQESDPAYVEALVASNLKVMDHRFFQFAKKELSEARKSVSLSEADSLSKLILQLSALVHTFGIMIDDEVGLELAQDTLQDLLQTESLEDAMTRIDEVAKNGTLTPTLVMLLGRARVMVDETSSNKQLQTLTQYLHLAAKNTLDSLMPAPIQILRALLDMEDAELRRFEISNLLSDRKVEAKQLLDLCAKLLEEFQNRSKSETTGADTIPEVIHQIKTLQREVYQFCIRETKEDEQEMQPDVLKMLPEFPRPTAHDVDRKKRTVEEFTSKPDPNRPIAWDLNNEDLENINQFDRDRDSGGNISDGNTYFDGLKQPKRRD